MGEDVLRETGIHDVQVVSHPANKTTALDTKIAVQNFIERDVDLILFCGGDGTARDVFDVVGRKYTNSCIPSGVKMYSAVFAIDPSTAQKL